MNILVLTSEYPYEKDNNTDRTKVVGYFAKEWIKEGHTVIVIVNSTIFPKLYYIVGNILKRLVSKIYDISRLPNQIWTKRFNYQENGVIVENIPILKIFPHAAFSDKALKNQKDEIIKTLEKRKFSPDLVTGHWVNPQLMLVPDIAKYYKADSAIVFHADYSEKKCKRIRAQGFINQIDHVGFRSKYAVETAKRYLKFKVEPFIAYSGIPDEYIITAKEKPMKSFYHNGIRIITAGRLVEYKKIDVIVKAVIKAYGGQDYKLYVAGDGPLKQTIEDCIRDNNAQSQISMLGQVSREFLLKTMDDCDIFILISLHETFGLVYLEAMLQGCIVIASRHGGIDGIIIDGENGFLCEEGNERELTCILNKISSLSVEEKQKISKQAKETACAYSESSVARKYIEIVTKH